VNCPVCKSPTRTVDSRPTSSRGYESVRRRRECLSCLHRFTTFEALTDETAIDQLEMLEKKVEALSNATLATFANNSRIDLLRAIADILGIAHESVCTAAGMSKGALSKAYLSEEAAQLMRIYLCERAAERFIGVVHRASPQPSGDRPEETDVSLSVGSPTNQKNITNVGLRDCDRDPRSF